MNLNIDEGIFSRDKIEDYKKVFRSEANKQKQQRIINLSQRLYDSIPAQCWKTEQTLADELGETRRYIIYAKIYLWSNGLINIKLSRNGKRNNPVHTIIKLDKESDSDLAVITDENSCEIKWELFNELSAYELNYFSLEEFLYLYAKMNFRFIPLHYSVYDKRNRKRCSCRWGRNCENPGKHPRFPYKNIDFSNPKVVNALKEIWLEEDIRHNIGFVIKDFIVVDVDFRNGGEYSFDTLQEDYGEIPKGLCVKTGNGFHFYVKGNKLIKNATNILGLRGIDIRSNGGIVVAPFSVHHSSKLYEWYSVSAPEPLPTDLLEALRSDEKSVVCNEKKSIKEFDFPLPYEFDESIIIQIGYRNDTLFRAASRERGRGKEFDQILTIIEEINEMCCKPKLMRGELKIIAGSASGFLTNAEKELALAP